MKEWAKSCVFREYRNVISLGNTFVQHEHDEESEFSKLSGFYSVSFVFDQIQSMTKTLRHMETFLPFHSIFFTKQSISLLCFGVILKDEKSDVGSLESEPYYCNSKESLNQLRQNLELQTIQKICTSLIRTAETGQMLPFQPDIWGLHFDITENIFFKVLENLLKKNGRPDDKVVLPVDVNSRKWRQDVAGALYTLFRDKKHVIETRLKEICRKTRGDLECVSSQLESYKNRCHQNSISECKYL